MLNIRTLICTMLIGLIASSSMAQDTAQYQFTLEQAQTYAIDHFFLSKNAALDIEAAKKKVFETTAMGLPQVSAGATYTYIPDVPEIPGFFEGMPPITMGETHNVNYNVMLTQLIFSGEYIVGLQAAKTVKTFNQENFDKIKIDLRENIASTYYGVLILHKNRGVLASTLENLKQTLGYTTKFHEQGLVEQTDVDQLSLTVKRTENSLRSVDNQIAYMEKMLKYQMGIDAETSVKLTDNIDALIEKNIISPDAYAFNLEDNITYKLMATNENIKLLNVKYQKSLFLPSLSGFYKYSDQMKSPAFDTNIKNMFGINLSVPILSSGMRISKVGQANIALDQAKNIKEQEAQRLILIAEQAQLDYSTSLQNYLNEKENIDLSGRIFNNATVKHKEGVLSALDLSIINTQYLQAQLSYASAVQSLLTSKIALDKAYSKL